MATLKKIDFANLSEPSNHIKHALCDLQSKLGEIVRCLYYKRNSWGVKFVKKINSLQQYLDSTFLLLPVEFTPITDWDEIAVLCVNTYYSIRSAIVVHLIDEQPPFNHVKAIASTYGPGQFFSILHETQQLQDENDDNETVIDNL